MALTRTLTNTITVPFRPIVQSCVTGDVDFRWLSSTLDEDNDWWVIPQGIQTKYLPYLYLKYMANA
jgi:hypothetical protein